MRIAAIGRQIPAGVIIGLSAIIYSISYGALLFSGPLAGFVGFGITIALITAIVGAVFGWISEDKTFFSGPDSNTISVLASMLAVLGSLNLSAPRTLDLAVATVLLTTILSAVAFYAIARANLSGLVRYIPFSVMAGFLASTGWLMSSGALNIIAGTPLSLAGLETFIADPLKPQLAAGLLVVATLYGLASRVSSAILIPLVMLMASIVVNMVLASSFCETQACDPRAWLFPSMQNAQWLPPWRLEWQLLDTAFLVENLPGMFVVSFVGLLTILLSVASLELSTQREFNLNKVLKAQAYSAGLAAVLGGFVGILSVGRTTLHRQTGGGVVSGTIAAAMCLAMLLGAGSLLAYVPKAALGGLVLFLGLNMLKQWLWDQRRTTSPIEYVQIILILALVANFGFLVGFAAGLLISCVVFVVTYSRIPLADLATNLSVFTSSVVRPEQEASALREHGEKTLLYRLSGYVFFGSASKIEAVFQAMHDAVDGVVLDFTNVSGIDSSAIGVFQRILRRYRDKPTQFYIVYADSNETSLRSISPDSKDSGRIQYFASLDLAVETAEERIIATGGHGSSAAYLEFLEDTADRATFMQHCEMRRIQKGELLCAEGERSAEVFFIADGSLEVIKAAGDAADLRLAKLHQGTMVGELAFYTGEARTASILAVTDSTVYVLRKDSLARLRAVRPDLATRFDHMVIDKISRALTRTNKLVAMFR